MHSQHERALGWCRVTCSLYQQLSERSVGADLTVNADVCGWHIVLDGRRHLLDSTLTSVAGTQCWTDVIISLTRYCRVQSFLTHSLLSLCLANALRPRHQQCRNDKPHCHHRVIYIQLCSSVSSSCDLYTTLFVCVVVV